MKYVFLFVLPLLFCTSSYAQEACSDFLINVRATGYSSLKNSTTGETSLAPDSSIWVADKESNLFVLNSGGGSPRTTIKLNGPASSSVIFMGDSPTSKGIIGTDNGWIYALKQDGTILWKKRVLTEDGFTNEAVKISDNEYALISATGIPFRISKNGELLDTKINPSESSNLVVTSKSGAFSEGSLIFSGYQLNDSGDTIYKTRIVKADGHIIEYKTPQIVTHAPGMTSINGKQAAVLFGTKGLLRFINENGADVIASRQLSCGQQGGFTKFGNDQFVASCIDSKSKKPKLISIASNGAVSEIMALPASPLSDFAVVNNPATGRPNIVAGFMDGFVRTIDPISGVITSEWTDSDKFSGDTSARPTPTDTGFIVHRDKDIVNLNWQTGSSSKQPIKTSNKNCGKTRQSSESVQDHSS